MGIDWKYAATNYLQEHACKVEALTNIQEEIKRLEFAATSIRSATVDSSPVRGGGSRREDMLLNNIVLRDELKRNLTETRKTVNRVEKGLSALSAEERKILDRFYIHQERGAAEHLACDLGIDVKTVYAKKTAALRRFTIAMYGRTES